MNFIIWGFSYEELEFASETVDALMKSGDIGRNEIRYQIIGEEKTLWFDTGFLSDAAIQDLQNGFIITAA